jgi:hypothetical protein
LEFSWRIKALANLAASKVSIEQLTLKSFADDLCDLDKLVGLKTLAFPETFGAKFPGKFVQLDTLRSLSVISRIFANEFPSHRELFSIAGLLGSEAVRVSE